MLNNNEHYLIGFMTGVLIIVLLIIIFVDKPGSDNHITVASVRSLLG